MPDSFLFQQGRLCPTVAKMVKTISKYEYGKQKVEKERYT